MSEFIKSRVTITDQSEKIARDTRMAVRQPDNFLANGQLANGIAGQRVFTSHQVGFYFRY